MTAAYRVLNLRIERVEYVADGQRCIGSNLLYEVNGAHCSSRVPWIATDPKAETARLERLLQKTRKET